MAYLARLNQTAAVYRPTPTQSDTGTKQANYGDTPVSGLGAVRCLLMPADQRRVVRDFGPDIKCDALVDFMAGSDIRPNLSSADGLNDRLVITDRLGNSRGTWMVVATRNPAGADLMLTAAVVRATGQVGG